MSSSRPEFLRRHSYSTWGERNGVHAEFLPFEFWSIDPIEFLIDIRDLIENTPKTAKTISVAALKDDYGHRIMGVSEKLEPLFKVHGSWQAPDDDWIGRAKYVNPNYVHLDNLTEDYIASTEAERLELVRDRAELGVLSQTDICPQVGFAQSGLASFLLRRGIEWSNLRSDGLQRIGQTWYTIYNWGYQWTEIAEAFDYQPGSIRRTIRDNVPDDFTPPADPSLADTA